VKTEYYTLHKLWSAEICAFSTTHRQFLSIRLGTNTNAGVANYYIYWECGARLVGAILVIESGIVCMLRRIKTSNDGFSLVELMIVIAIVAILLVIALPSFRDTFNRNRITTESNDLVTAFTLARSEAITRTVPVSVCPSSTGTSCIGTGAAADWGRGWIVFVDQGVAGTVDGSDSVIRLWPAIATAQGDAVTPGTATVFIQFLPDGSTKLATTPLIFTFTPTSCYAKARQVIVSQFGRTTATCT
jgi:type IV fimbrial biogenesis protein FimT